MINEKQTGGFLPLALLFGAAAVLSLFLQLGLPETSYAETTAVSIQGFAFSPATLTVPRGTTVVWTNADNAPHTATSENGPFDSPVLNQGGTFSFTFNSSGMFQYHCDIHPSMRGTVVVTAAAAPPAAPTATSPASGATLTDFGPTLAWDNPAGATQVHLQVIPVNNDGLGIDLHLGSPAESFPIPAPPQWFGLLPDMTYTWRVRVSNASTFADLGDSSWSEWATRTFRTPQVSSDTISRVSPVQGETVTTRTPMLQWANSRSDVFYYEVQVSKDIFFGLDAFLYWELRHGGATNPPNSYTIPPQFPLETGTPYFWRVRPRIQGDGTPLNWSVSSRFVTAGNAE